MRLMFSFSFGKPQLMQSGSFFSFVRLLINKNKFSPLKNKTKQKTSFLQNAVGSVSSFEILTAFFAILDSEHNQGVCHDKSDV